MSSDQKVLETVAGFFKANYPGLTAETVACFVILTDLGGSASMLDIGRALQMPWEDVHQHLGLLAVDGGAGLVNCTRDEEGVYVGILTEEGIDAQNQIALAMGRGG